MPPAAPPVFLVAAEGVANVSSLIDACWGRGLLWITGDSSRAPGDMAGESELCELAPLDPYLGRPSTSRPEGVRHVSKEHRPETGDCDCGCSDRSGHTTTPPDSMHAAQAVACPDSSAPHTLTSWFWVQENWERRKKISRNVVQILY